MNSKPSQGTVQPEATFGDALIAEIGKIVVGQRAVVSRVLIGLLTGGHVLIEGLPGLAKTLVVRSLAAAVGLTFRRIQFTPDLLPADLTGTLVFDPRTADFRVHRGPLFANIVLADEINRAPAKVQSALLQAMQERGVTIGEDTYVLDEPFLVLATQNPIEHDGTYPLPEAQLDRFLMHVLVRYPSREEELEIVQWQLQPNGHQIGPVTTREQILAARQSLGHVYVDSRIRQYIVDLTRATRHPADIGLAHLSGTIRYGASPRAAVHLALAARAQAFLSARDFVLPEDVHAVFSDVLRHRVLLTYEAEADGVGQQAVLDQVLAKVPIP